jgi:hypothetical protein
MDEPRSHITPDLALRSDDTPSTLSLHPKLPPLTAALLEHWHRELCEQGNDAALLQAHVLAQLVASDDAMPSWVHESRRRRAHDYVHPTVLVEIWRRPDLRPDLRKLVRKTGFAWQDARRWLQLAANHEDLEREFLMARLLISLAKMAALPDESYVSKVASWARKAADEWRAATVLREHGLMKQAEVHLWWARLHLCYAQNLAREWTPDEKALIRAVRGPLSWQLGFLGYGIAAKLVGAALNRPITRRQARYKSSSS